MHSAVLGLGTNFSDRLGHLRAAMRALRGPGSPVHVRSVSAIYESDAMLPEGAPESWNVPFLNLACLVDTELSPEALLAAVKQIERRLGREPTSERWAPRAIDIDLLAFPAETRDEPTLTLPHAGLLKRPFALLPLAELAPHWPVSSTQTATEAAATWRFARTETIPFRTRRTTQSLTSLVGIVNITPDSFSDGGRFLDPNQAIAQSLSLIAAGAEVLDFGAESTRPDATPVNAEAEWTRLGPVLKGLRGRIPPHIRISVDTRSPRTAERSIEAGAHWINDVSGAMAPEILRVLTQAPVDVVVMHSLSVPPRREETLPPAEDALPTLIAWGRVQLERLERAGIARERVILDPGIGFGKTVEQNQAILRRSDELATWGARTLIGHSRKSFLAGLPGLSAERDVETIAISLGLAERGADYLRVHAVEAHRQAFQAQITAG